MMKRLIAIALTAAPLGLAAVPPLLLTAAPADARRPQSGSCGSDSYVNSRGNCVHRPVASRTVPAGATARCRDGTYSFSQSRRGTCSYHGGVARWL